MMMTMMMGPTRELKKQWTLTVTLIPVVVGALEMLSKGLEKTGVNGNQTKN